MKKITKMLGFSMKNINRTFKKKILILYIPLFLVLLVTFSLNHLIYFQLNGTATNIIRFYLSLVTTLLIFLAPLIPILLVFRSTENLDEKKKFRVRLLTVAFTLPITYSISSLIVENINVEFLKILTFICYFLTITVLLPGFFLIAVCIPKKHFNDKKFALVSIFTSFCVGWIVLFLFSSCMFILSNARIKRGFSDYKPAIEYIEHYKKQHGIYPINIKGHLKPSRAFSHYEYKTYNNNKDFSLNIREEKTVYPNYSYCSSIAIQGCNDDDNSPIVRNYVGKWVKEDIGD